MEEDICIEFNNDELILGTNFSEICRICLVDIKGTPFVDLLFEDKRVTDILSSHLVMEVKPHDFLPQNICNCCSEEVLKMCSFIEKCRKANDFLQTYLKFTLKNDQIGMYDETIKEQGTTDFMKLDDLVVQDRIEVDCTNSSANNCESVVDEGHSDVEIQGNGNNLDTGRDDIIEEDDKEKNSMCSICFQYFTSSRLKQHMKFHTDNVHSHQCPTCLKHCTKENLKRHIMRNHTKNPVKCQVCFKIFKFQTNLNRHMMVHTGKRPFICEICGKAFSQLTGLNSHKKTHVSCEQIDPVTGEQSFSCSYCGRTFKRLAPYDAHIKKHKMHENQSIDDDDKASTEENTKLYECTICKKSYKTKPSLNTHRLQHREKSFLCNTCGKQFLHKAALEIHFTVHTGEKPHNCKFCPKSFARLVSLDLHLLTHTGVKPHKCNVCRKSFTQPTHLRYHMLTHTGERAYECNYCGKRFALKGNLTVHVRTHTGETPYKCSVCDKGFYDSSNMKKHKKGHDK